MHGIMHVPAVVCYVTMASLQHMQRLQVQLTEAQASNLRKTAESEGTSQAEIVRRALEAYLRRPIHAREAAVRARALELIGAFSSGVSDVAENHDRYLAEAILKENEPTAGV
jgi:CRISPR/Cas system-associated protein Csm6